MWPAPYRAIVEGRRRFGLFSTRLKAELRT
jgi:hypothetical protein